MKRLIVVSLVLLLLVLGVSGKHASLRSTISLSMKLVSPAFANNGTIPSAYTCDGQNINPPLSFEDVPIDTKSLVLIVDDPDAPMGTWVHWVVFNIPPIVHQIQENSSPQGVESVTSFGKPGYGGPCPPTGVHHYHFKLYALDSMLSLDQSAKKFDVEQAMQRHIVAHTELVGLYSRGK